jgi:hypothetical protein
MVTPGPGVMEPGINLESMTLPRTVDSRPWHDHRVFAFSNELGDGETGPKNIHDGHHSKLQPKGFFLCDNFLYKTRLVVLPSLVYPIPHQSQYLNIPISSLLSSFFEAQ